MAAKGPAEVVNAGGPERAGGPGRRRYAGEAMGAPGIRPDRAGWRPQSARAARATRSVTDPIIEPLWEGVRVLAHVRDGRARLIDEDGEDVGPQFHEVVVALERDVAADDAVLDGWLTNQATRSSEGVAVVGVEAPKAMDLLFGSPRPRPPRVAAHDRPEAVAFIAVDLLLLDGEALLDVPLLERKRLLDSVVLNSELVRSSPYVRPPLDRWLTSWQAAGFRGAVLKGANGRYRPGRAADDWAVVQPIPRR